MTAQLDPELVAVNSLMEAWGRDARDTGSRGGMHPLERLRLLHDGAVFGCEMSNDEIMISVDRVFLMCPARTRAMLLVWYRSHAHAPSTVKSHRLGISRTALYNHWRAALWFIRGALVARGLRV
jgi:hypothetical protein